MPAWATLTVGTDERGFDASDGLPDRVPLSPAARAASGRRDRLRRQKGPRTQLLIGVRLRVVPVSMPAQPILAALRAWALASTWILGRFRAILAVTW